MAYLPLSTANLPNPAIDPAQGSSPEDYFGISLWNGNNGTQSISDLAFQPDFVWGKKRGTTVSDHSLFDAVRGTTKVLFSNLTNSEETQTGITSFDSNGFTMGSWGGLNSTGTYVGWSWKANGSGVSNTDGTITSTVSANTTSGFSVLTYTGNGTNGATIGHGIGATPTFFIIKRRDGTGWSWYTYHKDGKGALGSLYLNSSGTGDTDSTHWNNTAPSSSVITLGTANGINQSSGTYVCYAFAPVDGFSKVGSYTGNGSTDGPFVYTGFRPAFVIIKNADFAEIWPMYDDMRDADNQVENPVYANLSSSEGTASTRGLDFLSNGFKIRGTDTSVNRSGDTHIYMALAENPFKYSNAR